ncbi:integrase catalytic domain-containing protein [Trichonephila clavipes]|uniref:Integrase catalytic domain-containing protein n=1 Tax=Trichonephila clavipes TaxID=2585209 RepID=A0A8X6SFY0_TRICX|nr:integrase catalytic domain-containing protein [Trichonephila clavipes]
MLRLGKVMRVAPENWHPPLQTTVPREWENLGHEKFNVQQPSLRGGSSVAPRLEPATRRLRVHYHKHKAIAATRKRLLHENILIAVQIRADGFSLFQQLVVHWTFPVPPETKQYFSLMDTLGFGTVAADVPGLQLEAFTSEKTVSKDTSVTDIEIKLIKIEQLQINLDKIAEDYCEIETFDSLEIIQLDIEDINQRIETTEEGNVILQNTKFGYLVTGTLPQSQQQANCCLISEPSLDTTVKKFFELESLPDDSKEITKSEEEICCEEHFVSTYKRDKTGRFIVWLPIKKNAETLLRYSKENAVKRLNGIWEKLNKNNIMGTLYKEFMSEYDILGHIEEIENEALDLQQIVWKTSAYAPVKTYKLATVTYGTVSAPFLATRTLKALGDEEKAEFPDAADVICNDSYIDDILSGESTLEGAKKLQTRLSQLLLRGSFELHKWVSNSPELLKDLSASSYVFDKEFQDTPVKTLGRLWDPKVYCLTYKVKISDKVNFSKRDVLSEIARLYDPLGLIGPIVTKAKIFIQELWKIKLDWSEQLPPNAMEEWKNFYQNYRNKSRVAPLKTLIIPRLKLSAALLLSRSVKKVVPILQLPIHKIWMSTDSTIALAWIKTEPHKLKTFLSNRVAEIQALSKNYHWKHVSSKNNPADLISRGCNVDELLKNEMWFSSPD